MPYPRIARIDSVQVFGSPTAVVSNVRARSTAVRLTAPGRRPVVRRYAPGAALEKARAAVAGTTVSVTETLTVDASDHKSMHAGWGWEQIVSRHDDDLQRPLMVGQRFERGKHVTRHAPMPVGLDRWTLPEGFRGDVIDGAGRTLRERLAKAGTLSIGFAVAHPDKDTPNDEARATIQEWNRLCSALETARANVAKLSK